MRLVFRTTSNIYDSAFLRKLLTAKSRQLFTQKSSIKFHKVTKQLHVWYSRVNRINSFVLKNRHFDFRCSHKFQTFDIRYKLSQSSRTVLTISCQYITFIYIIRPYVILNSYSIFHTFDCFNPFMPNFSTFLTLCMLKLKC